MCSIAGHFGPHSPDEARCKETLRCLAHRGPDAEGIYRHGRLTLLHNRLSILDLHPRSNQPFCFGGQALAYNGELYNHRELTESLGLHLSTTGDTEVLARLLKMDGVDCLDRLEGMWAFAHYDERSERLLLCRDRFGEKPLYIWRQGEDLYFASEVKGLVALSGRRPRPNLDQLNRYLVNGYKALYKKPRTFFEEVEEIPPAHYLIWDSRGGGRACRYWKPRIKPARRMTFEEAVEGTRERLTEALRIRLRSDRPLAFCLSGGIDSNALVALAHRQLGQEVHGFTIVNDDPRYEERRMVEASVQALGIRHTPLPVQTGGFLEGLRELIGLHDAPVLTINYYAQWRLYQEMRRQGYQVALSGTGADELFSGYYDHHLFYLREVRGEAELHRISLENWKRVVQPIVRNPFLQDPERFVEEPEFRGHIYLNSDEFSKLTRSGWKEDFRETRYCHDLLRNRMMNETFHEAVPVILHEDDRNAMSVSMENRSPYLDRRLFEWANSIPTRLLVRNGRAKAVLREAARGLVPDTILDNPRKVGFNAPLESFLDLEEAREELLSDSPIFEMVDRAGLAKLLERRQLPNSYSKFLFSFINARIFLEGFS